MVLKDIDRYLDENWMINSSSDRRFIDKSIKEITKLMKGLSKYDDQGEIATAIGHLRMASSELKDI